MIYLRQSTASQEVQLGPYFDPADFDTPKLALTIAAADIQIWKAGASVTVNKNSGGATHMSGDTQGLYVATFDATDTDTCGSGKISTHPTGATAFTQEFCILPQNVYDSFVVGTSQVTTADIATANRVEMDTNSTKLIDILAAVLGIGDVTVDGIITRDQVATLLLAVFGGTATGLTGATKVFKDQAGNAVATGTFTNNGSTRQVVLTF